MERKVLFDFLNRSKVVNMSKLKTTEQLLKEYNAKRKAEGDTEKSQTASVVSPEQTTRTAMDAIPTKYRLTPHQIAGSPFSTSRKIKKEIKSKLKELHQENEKSQTLNAIEMEQVQDNSVQKIIQGHKNVEVSKSVVSKEDKINERKVSDSQKNLLDLVKIVESSRSPVAKVAPVKQSTLLEKDTERGPAALKINPKFRQL